MLQISANITKLATQFITTFHNTYSYVVHSTTCAKSLNSEVPFVHYLVENKIWRETSVPLIVLPAKQNQRPLLVFIILYEIDKHDETYMLPTSTILWRFSHMLRISIRGNIHNCTE
jgi:hypothetical protein